MPNWTPSKDIFMPFLVSHGVSYFPKVEVDGIGDVIGSGYCRHVVNVIKSGAPQATYIRPPSPSSPSHHIPPSPFLTFSNPSYQDAHIVSE